MLQHVLSRFSPTVRQYAIVILLKLHCIPFGISLAWPSSVLVKLRNENTTVLPEMLTIGQEAWIVSIPYYTALLTTFMVGFLVDIIGRRYCLILTCLPKWAACFLLLFANRLWMILLARALEGVTFAFVFAMFSLYASEIASKENRGPLGTLFQLTTCVGAVIALGVGPFTSYVTLQVILTSVTVITSIPLLFMPESPYYLHTQGRREDALKLLTVLRGTETLADQEINSYTKAKVEKIDFKSLIHDFVFLKAFGICTFFTVWLHVTGGNVVTFYLQTILESANTTLSSEISSLVIGLMQLGAACVTPILISRFRRRTLLLSTMLVMTTGMVCLGISFEIGQKNSSGFLNYLPLIAIILVIFGFSSGPVSVYWLIQAELFDGPTRGVGNSLSLVTSYVSIIVMIQYFPVMTSTMGPANTYWFFSVACAIFITFIAIFVPETKGKTFAEIQVILRGKRCK